MGNTVLDRWTHGREQTLIERQKSVAEMAAIRQAQEKRQHRLAAVSAAREVGFDTRRDRTVLGVSVVLFSPCRIWLLFLKSSTAVEVKCCNRFEVKTRILALSLNMNK